MSNKRKTLGGFTHSEIANALASLTPLSYDWVEKRAFVRLNGQLFHLPQNWSYPKMTAAAEMVGGEIVILPVTLAVAKDVD